MIRSGVILFVDGPRRLLNVKRCEACGWRTTHSDLAVADAEAADHLVEAHGYAPEEALREATGPVLYLGPVRPVA